MHHIEAIEKLSVRLSHHRRRIRPGGCALAGSPSPSYVDAP